METIGKIKKFGTFMIYIKIVYQIVYSGEILR